MSTKTLTMLVALAATLVAGSEDQYAAEGRIPITGPTTIQARGSYVVTRNISGTGPLLVFAADGIDVDLNGFTLEETSLTHSVIEVTGAKRGAIHDGTLVGGFNGVSLLNAHNSRLTNLTVLSSVQDGISILGTHDFAVVGCRIDDSGERGIIVASQQERGFGLIVGNTIRRSLFEAILVSDLVAGVIESNVIRDCGRIGIYGISSDALVIGSNVIQSSGTYGMAIESSGGSRIVDNSVRDADYLGLQIGDACDGNYVGRNLVTSSANIGLGISGDRTYIVENWLLENTFEGLKITGAQGSVYRENTARGNTASPATCSGAGATTDFCNAGTQSTSLGDNYLPARQ